MSEFFSFGLKLKFGETRQGKFFGERNVTLNFLPICSEAKTGWYEGFARRNSSKFSIVGFKLLWFIIAPLWSITRIRSPSFTHCKGKISINSSFWKMWVCQWKKNENFWGTPQTLILVLSIDTTNHFYLDNPLSNPGFRERIKISADFYLKFSFTATGENCQSTTTLIK